MPNNRSSTLFSFEKSFQPITLFVTYTCCGLVAVLLAWTALSTPLVIWLACALPSLALEASNLHYRSTHPLATVGMIPVALFSLITPLIACLCSPALTGMLRGIVALCLVPLIALLALFVFWFIRLRRVYSAHPQISPTAALIVLGGAIKRGRPCETLSRRLDTAERLWQQQNSLTIVVSGGPTPDNRTTEAREMARYLQQRGVKSTSLILEGHARNTRENIMLSTELLNEHGHRGQRCVVSSNYHLWRALRDAGALGATLTPIAAPTPFASILQQWCREVLTIIAGR